LSPDILSPWAYPASEAYQNISIHVIAEDDKEMRELIQEEEERQRKCMWLRLRNCEAQILPVQTRKMCDEKEKGDRQEFGGTETPMHPPQSLSTEKRRRESTFESRTTSEQLRIQRTTSWNRMLIHKVGIRGKPLNHLAEPKFFCRTFGW
jgi:hypothetical protein